MAIDKIIQEFELKTAEADKNIQGIIGRLNALESEFNQVRKDGVKAFEAPAKPANDLRGTIKRLGQSIATVFATREIVNFTKAAINAASDLNEELSKSQVIFGDAAKSVEEFAERAEQTLGQSKRTALDAASTFATFGKSAGLTGEDLATFSTDLVTLSADLASFNNTTPEDAILAIGAALRGEAEPIRRYGVLLDDAALRQEALSMKIVATTKQALTPQQKVLAAQSLIFKQTTDAQGDMGRTADGVANSQRRLAAQFENLQAELGQKLLPVFGKALKAASDLLEGLDADDILDFAKAAGRVVAVVGSMRLGNMIGPLTALTNGFKGATLSLKGFASVLKANPLGLILSSASLLASFLPEIIGAFDGLTETQKAIKEAGEEATEILVKEKVELNELATALKTTNPESKERAELLNEFNALAGTNLQNLEDEAANYRQLEAAVKQANNEFDRRITLAAQEAMAQKAKELQLEAQVEQEKIFLELQKEGISREEALAKVEKARTVQQLASGTVLSNVAQVSNLYNKYLSENGGLIDNLGKMQQQEKEATEELNFLQGAFQESTKDAQKFGSTIGDKGSGKGGTIIGAFEALNKQASELKENLNEAIAQDNIAAARQYAAALGATEAQLRNIASVSKGLMGELDFDVPQSEQENPFFDVDKLAEEFGIVKNEAGALADIYQQAAAQQDIFFEKALAQTSELSFQFIGLNQGLQQGLAGFQDFTGGLLTYAATQAGQYSDFAKALAITNLAIQKAQAIGTAIAGATAAAAAAGPGAPFVIAGYIASMLGTIISAFAEADALARTDRPQTPQFYEGTAYLKRNGAPVGRDTIPAMLNEGEAVIPTAKNTMYPGLAESWIKGDLDKYIHRNWVAPAMKQLEEKKAEDMADRLAQSIALNMGNGFDDFRLYRAIKEQTGVQRSGFAQLKQTRNKLRGGR